MTRYQIRQWGWSLKVSSAARALAVAMSDFASPTGGRMWPGHDLLVELTGQSPAALKRHLAELIAAGALRIVYASTGRGQRTEYAFCLPDQPEPEVRRARPAYAARPLPRRPVARPAPGPAPEYRTPPAPLTAQLTAEMPAQKGAHDEPISDSGNEWEWGSETHGKGLKSVQKRAHGEPPIEYQENSTRDESKRARGRALPEIPAWMPPVAWNDFLEARRLTGRPANALSVVRLIARLAAFRDAGEDLTEVLDQSIACGWTGVFPVKRSHGGNRGRPEDPFAHWRALGDAAGAGH